MSQPPSKPSYWATTGASIETYAIGHWTYIAVFLVGLVMGAFIF